MKKHSRNKQLIPLLLSITLLLSQAGFSVLAEESPDFPGGGTSQTITGENPAEPETTVTAAPALTPVETTETDDDLANGEPATDGSTESMTTTPETTVPVTPTETPAEPSPTPTTEPTETPAEPSPMPSTEPVETPTEPAPAPSTEPAEFPPEPTVTPTEESSAAFAMLAQGSDAGLPEAPAEFAQAPAATERSWTFQYVDSATGDVVSEGTYISSDSKIISTIDRYINASSAVDIPLSQIKNRGNIQATLPGDYEVSASIATISDGSIRVPVKKLVPEFSFTVASSDPAGGTVSGHASGEYEKGTEITVNATAEHGYHFKGWFKDSALISSDASYTFTLTEHCTLTAVFEEHYFSSWTPNPEPSIYNHTGICDYCQTPWTTSCSGGTATCTELAVCQYCQRAYGSYAEHQYGELVPRVEPTFWEKGMEAHYQCAACHSFFRENKNLVAHKEYLLIDELNQDTWPVRFVDKKSGAVVPSDFTEITITDSTVAKKVSDIVREGTVKTIPVSKLGFDMSQTPEDYKEPTEADIYADGSPDYGYIAIRLEKITYTIDIAALPAEGGTASGSGVYEIHTPVTVTAAANPGYHFLKWLENNISVNQEAQYTFPAENNRNLTAQFEECSWNSWKSNSDGTHTRICDVCQAEETKNCHGGRATCTAKAVCADCNTEYGEADPANHTNLVKTEAKPATHLEVGNKEYWSCDGCAKYFSDEAGTREIALKDTVIDKLSEHTPDETGWHTDEASHWKTCACGEILEKKAHELHWVIDKEATEDQKGSKHEECGICGYKKDAVEIPVIVKPTETPAEPTGTPTEPTVPPAEPTETPVKPTEIPAKPTEIPAKPTETPTEPTVPPTEPTETPTEPTVPPTEPTDTPAEPTGTPVEPTSAPTETPGQTSPTPTEQGKPSGGNGQNTNKPNPAKPGTQNKDTDSATPKTGDETNIVFWLLLVLTSVCVCVVLYLESQKRNRNKK